MGKQFSKLVVVLFLSFLQLLSCKKRDTSDINCTPTNFYYNLSDVEKAKVPYTGNDTLIFTSNTNDTAICIGQGKQQFYYKRPIQNLYECPPDTNCYEAYKYRYIDINYKLNITINNWFNDGYIPHVMEMFINTSRVYPINKSFLYESFYDDSASSNTKKYNTFRINNGLGIIVQYNLSKGIIQIQTNSKIWNRYE